MSQEMSKSKSFMYSVGLLFSSIFVIGMFMLVSLESIGIDGILGGILASQLGILIYGMFLLELDKDIIKDSLKFKLTKKDLILAIGAFAVILISNMSISLIISNIGDFNAENTENIASSSNIVVSLIFPIIIAPVFEEIAFRGGLRHLLTKRSGWSNNSYILISSVLFGLLHWQGGPMFYVPILVTFTIGIILGKLYVKTDSLVAPIISHMLYNLTILILTTI